MDATPKTSEAAAPEHWMRGPIAGVDALLAPVLYTLDQAREDLTRWTEGLTPAELWATPHGFGSVGFHVRHIARSTDRLLTYAKGDQLSAGQLAALKSEKDAGASRDELLGELEAVFREAGRYVRGIDIGTFRDRREIGRKRLPTTVIGLLTHVAEHTQRHMGQAISAAKLARAMAAPTEP